MLTPITDRGSAPPWRIVLLAALATIVVCAPAEAATVTGPVPTAYRLDLDWSPRGAGTLSGSQSIDLVNRGSRPVSDVWLRVWANGPDGCRPRRARVRVLAPARAAGERVGCSALLVRLAQPLAPGAAATIGLRLRIRGRRAASRFGRDGSTAFLGNVIPTLAVSGAGLPPYLSRAESFYSLSARWDATLSVPSRLRVASTGSVSSETVAGGRRRLVVATPQARDFALAVGRFRVTERTVGGVRIRVHSPGRARVRGFMARVAARSLRLFSSRFGPYGSPELDVVDVRRGPTGMEYPELVLSSPAAYVVAHEVAHQWWYSLVGNDQYREPWLDESFASYSDHLYTGSFRYCGALRRFARLPGLRRARLDWGMRRFSGRGGRIAYPYTVYDGGACSLRSLERRLGSARMTQLLRLIVSRHRGGVVTKADVLRAIGEVAPPGFRLRSWLRRARLSP